MATAIEVIELLALALAEIRALIRAGVSHGEAVRRIKRITEDASRIDRDVDAVARGREPGDVR